MPELISTLRDDDNGVRNAGLRVVLKLAEHSWSSAILPHCNG
jgi:hypothetical protein